jgi:hypothetical protein
MRERGWIGIIVAVVLLAAVAGSAGQIGLVRAQGDELSDEEAALVYRVSAALEQRDNAESAVMESVGTDSQSIDIVFGELAQAQTETVTWERTVTVIPGDSDNLADDNLQGTVSAQFEASETGPNGSQSRNYGVSAELRLVDDVLYVNAAYDVANPNLPELPDGWFVVDDLEMYEVLDPLQLDDILERDEEALIEDPEKLKAAAVSAAVEAATLDDGTLVDQITIMLGLNAMMDVFSEEDGGDPEAAAMALALLDAASDESELVLVAYLGADDVLHRLEMRLLLVAEDIDAQVLDPESFPEGVMISFSFDMTETAMYSGYGEPVDPAVAPEMTAAE